MEVIKMKIFLAGSTGRVATEVLKLLSAQGKKVIAGARRPAAVEKRPHVTAVKLDLHAPVDKLAELVAGVDAIIFTAGSRGKDLLQTDAYGAVKLMQAAQLAGVKRFVMLSALYSLMTTKWPASLTDYYIAKFFADNYLVNQTDLDYTIIQPGSLVSEPSTGLVAKKETLGAIPIGNVAAVLVAVVDKGQTYGQAIPVIAGDQPIAEIF